MNKDKSFDEIEARIKTFSDDIAKEIAQKRFYEMEDVRAIAKTRLYLALSEVVEMFVIEMEDERLTLVEQYNNPDVPNWKKEKIKARLSVLNNQHKKYKRANHSFEDYNDYQRLKDYLKRNGHEQILQSFFDKQCAPREPIADRLKRKANGSNL